MNELIVRVDSNGTGCHRGSHSRCECINKQPVYFTAEARRAGHEFDEESPRRIELPETSLFPFPANFSIIRNYGRSLFLRRSGAVFSTICPLHGERIPSCSPRKELEDIVIDFLQIIILFVERMEGEGRGGKLGAESESIAIKWRHFKRAEKLNYRHSAGN